MGRQGNTAGEISGIGAFITSDANYYLNMYRVLTQWGAGYGTKERKTLY